MRALPIAGILVSLLLPSAALAGPEGSFDVKGANPDDGGNYTGTVKIERKGEVYSVVWTIGGQETSGVGVGLRLVDGLMVAGPAGDADTGISISYAAAGTPGTATYAEQSDGTWRGVWAYQGHNTLSTEEWVPTGRQIRTTVDEVTEVKAEANPDTDSRAETQPMRVLSSPLPANASPKS